MPGVDCREFEGALLELARHGSATGDKELGAHLEACHECRSTLRAQRRLSAAVNALADDAARFTAPAGVEKALRAELDSMRSSRRRRVVFGALGGALAASLAAFWWIAERPAPKVIVAGNALPVTATAVAQPEPEHPRVHRRRVARPAAEPAQPFIAIPYTLPLEPYERADVMRMDLPVSALIAAGLPMSMMDPVALARADVLVGADGQARAIRLISISDSN
jgi:hypothetical protein